MTNTSKKHHAGQKPISIWVADDLAERIDAHLRQQVAGIVGARPSRQAWIVAALEMALAAPPAAPELAPAPAKAEILLLRCRWQRIFAVF